MTQYQILIPSTIKWSKALAIIVLILSVGFFVILIWSAAVDESTLSPFWQGYRSGFMSGLGTTELTAEDVGYVSFLPSLNIFGSVIILYALYRRKKKFYIAGLIILGFIILSAIGNGRLPPLFISILFILLVLRSSRAFFQTTPSQTNV